MRLHLPSGFPSTAREILFEYTAAFLLYRAVLYRAMFYRAVFRGACSMVLCSRAVFYGLDASEPQQRREDVAKDAYREGSEKVPRKLRR